MKPKDKLYQCTFCGEEKNCEMVLCFLCKVRAQSVFTPYHRICPACWRRLIREGHPMTLDMHWPQDI